MSHSRQIADLVISMVRRQEVWQRPNYSMLPVKSPLATDEVSALPG